MNHRQASRLIVEWVDGALAPDVADAVERHVTGCHDCGEISRLYRMMRRMAAPGDGKDRDDGPDGPSPIVDPSTDHPADSQLYLFALGMHEWGQ